MALSSDDSILYSPPDAFGPFRVLHQIGAGALGPVFRAHDRERDRLVSIKVFRLDLPPEQAHALGGELTRLVERNLSHPSIAAPLAAGVEGTVAYLAFEHVAGDSLDAVLRQHGPAPLGEALRLATRLAGALDYASASGVEHGALHPRDILIGPDEVRVTGFGIARALERIGVRAPVRRPYAAPERVDGRAWSRAADEYALAAIVHELLTARRVPGDGAAAAAELDDIAGADRERLATTFARALRAEPADRFPTALAFAAALTEAANGAEHAAAASEAPTLPFTREMEPPPMDSAATLPSPTAMERGPREATSGEQGSPHVADALIAGDPTPPTLPAPPDVLTGFAPAQEREEDELYLRESEPSADADVPDQPQPDDADESTVIAAHPVPDAAPIASEPFLEARRQAPRAPWSAVAAGLLIGVVVGAGGYHFWPAGGQAGTRSEARPETPRATAGREATDVAVQDAPSPPEETAAPGPRPPAPGSLPPALSPRPPASDVPPPAPGLPARLLVRSTPAGAAVYIDGERKGVTPLPIRGLSYGLHTVRVVRDGYVAEQRRVTLSSRRPSMALNFSLGRARPTASLAPRYMGSVAIDSRPAGASVYFDGRLVGETPLSLADVAAGSHAVRIEQPGYERWTSSVRIVAGARARVNASLDRSSR